MYVRKSTSSHREKIRGIVTQEICLSNPKVLKLCTYRLDAVKGIGYKSRIFTNFFSLGEKIKIFDGEPSQAKKIKNI